MTNDNHEPADPQTSKIEETKRIIDIALGALTIEEIEQLVIYIESRLPDAD